jgi:hypothetical protein
VGLVADMFERFMSRQSVFFDNLSKEAKKKMSEVENKFAVLEVTGPEGGTFYFQYKHQQLLLLNQKPDVPYDDLDKLYLDGDIYNYPSGDEVLFDIIDGELSPRAAVSRKYFRVNTDKVIYDTEEFAQAFERFLDEMKIVLKTTKK